MVAWNQMEFDGKRGSQGSQLLDKLAAAAWQDHVVFLAVEDGGTDRPQPVETGLPIGLAFLDPFPRDGIITMRRLAVPGHPAAAVPIVASFWIDRSRAQAHHIEGGGDEHQPFNFLTLLRQEPGDPASE